MGRMYGGDTRGGEAGSPRGLGAKMDEQLRMAFKANRLRIGVWKLSKEEQRERMREVAQLTRNCQAGYHRFRRHPFVEQREGGSW